MIYCDRLEVRLSLAFTSPHTLPLPHSHIRSLAHPPPPSLPQALSCTPSLSHSHAHSHLHTLPSLTPIHSLAHPPSPPLTHSHLHTFPLPPTHSLAQPLPLMLSFVHPPPLTYNTHTSPTHTPSLSVTHICYTLSSLYTNTPSHITQYIVCICGGARQKYTYMYVCKWRKGCKQI